MVVKISKLRQLMQDLPPEADPTDAAWRGEYIRHMGLDPGDIYQELEMDSPFVDTHRDESDAASPVNLHSHSFFEIIYCRGACELEYLVGSRRYRLQKGDVVIVPPGLSHRPLLFGENSGSYLRDVVWISEEFMHQLRKWFPELLQQSGSESMLLRTDDTAREEIDRLFDLGVQEAEKRGEEWEVAVVGNTITLLTQLHRACMDRVAKPMKAEKPEMLDRVLRYIEENLSGKITLADTARHFFVSESTITQLFRKKMGVSFYHCVTQRRLIAAKALIDRNVKLEQVGEQVGFTDYSAFYRSFKKEFGISPAQYRKLQQYESTKHRTIGGHIC